MREIPKLLMQAAVILTSAQVCNECFGVLLFVHAHCEIR